MLKKFFFFLILSQNFFSQKIECGYSVIFDSTEFKNTGKIKAYIKNIGNKNLDVPNKFSFCNLYLIGYEIYNEETKQYENAKKWKKDIDCFTYRTRNKNLKPNKILVYTLDLKSDFNIMMQDNFYEQNKNVKYRVKLDFPIYSKNCNSDEVENIDWIYNN